MEFPDLISSTPVEAREHVKEVRFSFIRGGCVEDKQNVNDEPDKE